MERHTFVPRGRSFRKAPDWKPDRQCVADSL